MELATWGRLVRPTAILLMLLTAAVLGVALRPTPAVAGKSCEWDECNGTTCVDGWSTDCSLSGATCTTTWCYGG